MMKSLSLFVLLLVFQYQDLAQAWTTALPAQQPLPILNSTLASFNPRLGFLKRRQNAAKASTCGFGDGRSDQARTANPGFDCRFDTKNAIWGFCPTTVLVVSDCGLSGACIDSHGCSDGCGISADPSIATVTCTGAGADYCSTAILTAGPDQTYSYIACANSPITDHLLAVATTTPSPSPTTTSRTTITESSTPAPTSSSSDIFTSSPSSSSAGTAEAVTSPPSTAPSQSTHSSSSTNSASSPSTPVASSAAPDNIGAIVGGAIGGAALICFVVLGVMLLRRHQRNHDPPKAPEAVEAHFPYPSERETVADQRFMASYSKRYTPFEMSTQKHNSPFELPSEKMNSRRFELPS